MAGKEVFEEPALGGTAIKPVGWDRTGFEAFGYFLYNPDTGEVLSRTPLSWVKIILFYLIYYTCLAGFWTACLTIFFLTIDESKPRWILNESIIGSNPGLGVKPGMDPERIDSNLYILDNRDHDYPIRMEIYLESYSNNNGLHTCNSQDKEHHGKCIFNTSVLDVCGMYPYGYTNDGYEDFTLSPCFLIKLNKIFNFVPSPVKLEKLDSPEYSLMSQDLKDQIKRSPEEENVYIDCHGRFPADREAVQLTYFPSNRAIPTMFFPFTGGNYHSPVVAVKVTPREPSKGQLIHIECRAWFDGVIHSSKHKEGLTQFEVMVK